MKRRVVLVVAAMPVALLGVGGAALTVSPDGSNGDDRSRGPTDATR